MTKNIKNGDKRRILFIIFGLFGFLTIMNVVFKTIEEIPRIIIGFGSIVIGLVFLNSAIEMEK